MAEPKEGYNSGIQRVVSSGAIDSSGNYVTGGATPVAEVALAFGPIYDDGTYKYFGEATAGTALTAALWRVSRMAIATSQIEWADGNARFDNVFTSLAVVEALSFS